MPILTPRRLLEAVLFALATLTLAGCALTDRIFAEKPANPPPQQWTDTRPRPATPTPPPMASIPSPAEMAAGTVLTAAETSPAAAAFNVFGEIGMPGSAVRGVGPVRMAALAGITRHTFPTEGADADVNVEPAGQWLVFTSTRHARHPKIYVQRVGGQAVVQLTSDASDDAHPVFSPDGKRIAFASTRGGAWNLYTMDADGRNITAITTGPQHDLRPTWSPDGTQLAYCSLGGRGDQWEIWTIDLATGQRRVLGPGLFPSWSPSKTGPARIAFQRARERGSRWFSLWTMDLVEGEARRVTELAVSPTAAVLTPAWSDDGRFIAFATVAGTPAAGGESVTAGTQDIWVVDADGANRRRITDGTGRAVSPAWGPDGRVYFVSDRAGIDSVWSARGDTGANAPAQAAIPKPQPAPEPSADVSEPPK